MHISSAFGIYSYGEYVSSDHRQGKGSHLNGYVEAVFIFVPALLLLVHFFGLTGVEISQAAADVAAFLFSMPICLKVLNIMMTEENKIQ